MRTLSLSLISALMLFALSACGVWGGDEVAHTLDLAKQAKDATDADIAVYCETSLAKKGGPGLVTKCDGGMTTTVDTLEKCTADMALFKGVDCDLTMGQLVACQDAMAADRCAGFKILESPECEPIYGVFLSRSRSSS
jgi:predicted small lipoprotein YifL